MTRPQKPVGIGIEICFEHHAEDKWLWLADRAAEAGVSFVRLGEFVWDILESEEDRINCSKLDHWIRILADRGIDVVLATPTGSPPDWLCLKYPEIVPVKMDGSSYGTGVRRHTCPTAPRYRTSCERIVRALGRQFGKHPSVIAWQIDNEIGHPFCYCPLCHHSFQQWLKGQFDEIETFNFKAGQIFLGRTSRAFDEVPLPEAGSNPCLYQLYGRFMDHQIRACWGLQRDWLRQEGVRVPITTNAMLTWYGYDHEKFYEALDLVSGDVYPDGKTYQSDQFVGLAFYAAYLRGIKHGRNFGMMEMRCGPVTEGGPYPVPGEITHWANSLFAAGADFIHFFRLDTSPSGLERGAFGMIPASGAIPPIFSELKELCTQVKALAPLLLQTTVAVAPVGILYSHATHMALQCRPCIGEFVGPSGNGYTYHLARHFRALVSQNIPADIVYPGEEFQKYRVLILTGLAVLDAAQASKLVRYVESGGILIVGPWTGLMDENAKMWEVAVPAGLDAILGATRITTEAFDPQKVAIQFVPQPGTRLPRLRVSSVADQLKVGKGADVLARFEGHPAGAGLTALTRRPFGRGVAYSLAAFFDETSLATLYAALLKQNGIQPELRVPFGVQHTKRVGPECELHFFFNSTAQPVGFDLATPLHDLVANRPVERIELPPRGCQILRLLKSA
jgi:beta-galactosidase